MGHIETIKRMSIVIVSIAAIMSLVLSFTPQSYAGIDLSLDINAVCGTTADTSAVSLDDDTVSGVDPGQPATGMFGLSNTGTASQPVSADVGQGFFGPETTPILHIQASDVTLLSDGTNAVTPAVAMDNGGTPKPITTVDGDDSETVTITVSTSNLQNLPVSGTQSATLTLTLGTCT